jgi:hypothetical protein
MGIVDDLMTVPCIITSRTETGPVDRYNKPTWADASPVATVCFHEQVDAIEVDTGRETQIANHRIYLLAATTVDGNSRLDVADLPPLEVVGEPSVEQDPFVGTVDHIELLAREVVG